MGRIFAILGFMVMSIYWGVVIAVLGLLAGSFAGAQVWRLRRQQLLEEKAAKEPYDATELKRLDMLTPSPGKADRSHCLECGHVLAWYDLVPLLSWASTRGRCRYCNQRIGTFEPLIELATMLAFLLSFVFWPFGLETTGGIVLLALWLAAIVPAAILFAYDLRWSLLPDIANYALIAVAAVYALVAVYVSETTVSELAGSLVVLFGLYGGLYYFSRWRHGEDRTWVGFGDVKLSIALGLLALNWQTAFIVVFSANLIGTLIVIPGLLRRRIGRKAHIPFGPLLLIGTLIAVLTGDSILAWYFGLFSFPL